MVQDGLPGFSTISDLEIKRLDPGQPRSA